MANIRSGSDPTMLGRPGPAQSGSDPTRTRAESPRARESETNPSGRRRGDTRTHHPLAVAPPRPSHVVRAHALTPPGFRLGLRQAPGGGDEAALPARAGRHQAGSPRPGSSSQLTSDSPLVRSCWCAEDGCSACRFPGRAGAQPRVSTGSRWEISIKKILRNWNLKTSSDRAYKLNNFMIESSNSGMHKLYKLGSEF
jgi:hypothetical protein